jgi:hypothetical protein
MKTNLIITALLFSIIVNQSIAQDTLNVKFIGKDIVTVIEGENQKEVIVDSKVIDINSSEDTVKIRVGRKSVIVTDNNGTSNYEFNTLNDEEFEKWTGRKAKFKGHWAFFEMGVNTFTDVDYSGYDTENWMDINHNKSYEVNINMLRYSIGLQKNRNTVGLVTGIGLNFNDYRFSNKNTIVNLGGRTEPDYLEEIDYVSKSKLSTIYIHVPLILEFQIPVNRSHKRIYFSGGAIGGIKLRSHTKVKHDGKKDKDFNDFNINPFRYGVTARVGYRGINIFGTYYLSEFFKEGRGPVTQPFTIGIGIIHI